MSTARPLPVFQVPPAPAPQIDATAESGALALALAHRGPALADDIKAELARLDGAIGERRQSALLRRNTDRRARLRAALAYVTGGTGATYQAPDPAALDREFREAAVVLFCRSEGTGGLPKLLGLVPGELSRIAANVRQADDRLDDIRREYAAGRIGLVDFLNRAGPVAAERSRLLADAEALESAVPAVETELGRVVAAAIKAAGGIEPVAEGIREVRALAGTLAPADPAALASLATVDDQLAKLGSATGRLATELRERRTALAEAAERDRSEREHAAVAAIKGTVRRASEGSLPAFVELLGHATANPAAFGGGFREALAVAPIKALDASVRAADLAPALPLWWD